MKSRPKTSAREWGKKKAAERPRWSQQKWQRIGVILGVDINGDVDEPHSPPQDEAIAS